MSTLGPSTVVDYNVTLTSGDTEYSQAISGVVRHYQIKARTAVAVRASFTTGKVATPVEPYHTIKSGEVHTERELALNNPTFYFASSSAGTVVELRVWIDN